MLEINLDTKDLERGLAQLLKNATDNRPMMRGIATELVALTEDNFVSTHSRPKAAGYTLPCIRRWLSRFNSQPPEGGWFL